MAPPARSEAKEWAREIYRGVCNVIIPSYADDLRSLNEAAIRHAPDPADFFIGRNPA